MENIILNAYKTTSLCDYEFIAYHQVYVKITYIWMVINYHMIIAWEKETVNIKLRLGKATANN